MTPAERAVIDAARALEPVLGEVLGCAYVDETGVMRSYSGSPSKLREVVPAFLAAVRALPRPLSEQLAELRPGAEVDAMAGGETGVLMRGEIMANRPERQEVWFQSGAYWAGIMPYRDIRRVISNPEASDGR